MRRTMSAQQTITTAAESDFDLSLPAEIDSPRAKLVYLFVTVSEETTVDDIQDALAMKKISLFSILGTLSKRDLVEKSGNHVALA